MFNLQELYNIHEDTKYMNPEQEKQILSWTEQRDNLLSEISVLQNTKNTITNSIRELNQSHSEVIGQIQYKKGQLDSLTEEEKKQIKLTLIELVELKKQTTIQQRIVDEKKREVESLNIQKKDIESSLSILIPVYNTVTNQVTALNETIENVVRINNENIQEVNVIITDLKNALGDNITNLGPVYERFTAQLKSINDANASSILLSNKNANIVDTLIKELKKVLEDNTNK